MRRSDHLAPFARKQCNPRLPLAAWPDFAEAGGDFAFDGELVSRRRGGFAGQGLRNSRWTRGGRVGRAHQGARQGSELLAKRPGSLELSDKLVEIERLFGQYQCALRLAIRPTRGLLGLEPFLCGAGNQLPASLQQDGFAIAALHQRSARLALEFASAIELLAQGRSPLAHDGNRAVEQRSGIDEVAQGP